MTKVIFNGLQYEDKLSNLFSGQYETSKIRKW